MSQVIERARDEELHALDIDAWWRFSPGGLVQVAEGHPCCFESQGRFWVCEEHVESMSNDERQRLARDEAEFRGEFDRIPSEQLAIARETYVALYTKDGVALRGVYDDEVMRRRLGEEKEAPYAIARPREPELVLDPARNPTLLVAACLAVFLGYGDPWPPPEGPFAIRQRAPADRIRSVELAEAVGLTPIQLASRLRPLGIRPRDIRFPRGLGPEVTKGYEVQPFREAVSWLA